MRLKANHGRLAMGLTGCSAMERPFNSALGAVLGSSEFEPAKYQLTQWDVATNPAFKDQLRYKKFAFDGIYYGAENNPGRFEQVENAFTVRVCRDRTRQSCTSKVSVNNLYAKETLAIPVGTPVRVYGQITEISGIDMGGGARVGNQDGSFNGIFLISARRIEPRT